MENSETTYPDQAKQLVKDYYNALVANTDSTNPRNFVEVNQVYVVWFAKTLQNWKALLATTNEDALYFEVTHNGDKEETYIDMYMKVDNFVVKDA